MNYISPHGELYLCIPPISFVSVAIPPISNVLTIAIVFSIPPIRYNSKDITARGYLIENRASSAYGTKTN